ncbi:MAG: patatin-like phospholipase family protein [Magnetospirillum sp.]|nr:patatin-like phospholipase family protein [Magnetospirillum sp.]
MFLPHPDSGDDARDGGAPMKTVTLALQGGGTHGAFTWGVLDRLLEDERIGIEGISATSAGAINGALLVCGLAQDGRRGAREVLGRFWSHLGGAARFSPLQPTPLDRLTTRWGLSYSPVYQFAEAIVRLFSPYQLNPLDINPLRVLLRAVIDFDALRRNPPVKLFVSATNVRTGKVRIFDPHEIDEDVILAATSLPHLFRAVEIGGEPYWDGGYVANPAIYPLVRQCRSGEVVIVQVNPIGAREVPWAADAILHRINEISFNSSVMREMHALAFISGLFDRGWVHRLAGIKKTHIHMIHAEELMKDLHASSKFNAEPAFLDLLFEAGRVQAERWLVRHYDDLGKTSTIDVNEVYL